MSHRCPSPNGSVRKPTTSSVPQITFHVTSSVRVSPGTEPAEPLARVLSVKRSQPAEPAGAVFHGGQVIRRYFTPPKITVR